MGYALFILDININPLLDIQLIPFTQVMLLRLGQ
nr:hypothetical protein Q903MT_gene2686 [Picea sitchensis]